MVAKFLVSIALLCALVAQAAQAAPVLTVTPGGLVAGNRQWDVSITPDAALFSNTGPSGIPPNTVGGSLATELAFVVNTGNLVSVVANAVNWPSPNPGSNPFTNTVTIGTYQAGNNSFTAYGSDFFTSATPHQYLTITTLGSGLTTLSYGTAASGNSTKGNIIAQAGQTFRYTGVVSIPEPTTCAMALLALCGMTLSYRRTRRSA